ncbi:MAG: quinone oxidoreductase [Alphaproteobacteria bacterium]|nr:quinone oxidoreductase [Alphaproteobacteria bacterium]
MADQAWRIVVRTTGGPEAMEREDFDPGLPGTGEVLIAQEAIGLNFIDTYVRSGLYPVPLPMGLGNEAAGRIEAVGSGVDTVRVGDRVAYVDIQYGSYTTHRILSAGRVLKLPDAIACDMAAAMMLKGMTACFLVEDCAKMQSGQTALVHAAAGGVGLILVPWLTDMGVTVIAHSGTAAKADLARKAGAHYSLTGPFEALADEVRKITNGKGVDTVFDGVGKASWAASLDSLKRRGLMISFGNASGPVPPVRLLDLSQAGSLFVTRPTLFNYIETDEEYHHMGERLFDRIQRGVITSHIGQRYSLAYAAEAHKALESRSTTGSTVLMTQTRSVRIPT